MSFIYEELKLICDECSLIWDEGDDEDDLELAAIEAGWRTAGGNRHYCEECASKMLGD